MNACADISKNNISVRNWAALHIPLALMGAFIALFAILLIANIRINYTPSEPMGLYRVLTFTGASADVQRGSLIEFCHHGVKNKFMIRGACEDGYAPFVKQVIGMPGDTVTVADSGVSVNGVGVPHSRPLRFSIADPTLAMPVLRGSFTLNEGQYWVLGGQNTERSYDSRYFGAVSAKDIRAVAIKE